MSDDLERRKEKANREWREVLNWVRSEEKRVYERLKAEGKLESGLDGNTKDYSYIYRTAEARTKEIIHRYDLPNKASWT